MSSDSGGWEYVKKTNHKIILGIGWAVVALGVYAAGNFDLNNQAVHVSRAKMAAECVYGDRKPPTTNEELGRLFDAAKISGPSDPLKYDTDEGRALEAYIRTLDLSDCGKP